LLIVAFVGPYSLFVAAFMTFQVVFILLVQSTIRSLYSQQSDHRYRINNPTIAMRSTIRQSLCGQQSDNHYAVNNLTIAMLSTIRQSLCGQ